MAVSLHVGQAGIAMAGPLWEAAAGCAAAGLSQARPERLSALGLDEGGRARAVVVDAEPKAAAQLAERLRPRLLDVRRRAAAAARGKGGAARAGGEPFPVVTAHSGCGNNHALGYHGQGALVGRAMEAVRREAERLDAGGFEGVRVFHSLAGGTGSGLGCRLLAELRDQYPRRYALSFCVAPFGAGDTPLQHYNACLALARLQEHADAVCLFRNGDLLRALSRGGPSTRPVGLDALNRCAALAVWGLVAPLGRLEHHERFRQPVARGFGVGVVPWARLAPFSAAEFCAAACPLPSHKFVELWSTKGLGGGGGGGGEGGGRGRGATARQWSALADQLAAAAPRRREGGQAARTMTALVTARGNSDGSLDERAVAARVRRAFPLSPALPPGEALALRSSTRGARSLTVCANRDRVADYAGEAVRKARSMFAAGAYLHWYRRHGCEDADLEASFAAVEDVCASYLDESW